MPSPGVPARGRPSRGLPLQHRNAVVPAAALSNIPNSSKLPGSIHPLITARRDPGRAVICPAGETHRNAFSRVITGYHAFARIKNLEPKPSKPAPSRDAFLPDSFVSEAPAIQACTRPDKAKQASKKMRKQALFTSLACKASLLRPVAIRQPFARSRNIGKLQSGNVRHYQETSFLKDQRSQEMSGFVRIYQVIPHTALTVRKYQEILPPAPGDVIKQFRIAGTVPLPGPNLNHRHPHHALLSPQKDFSIPASCGSLGPYSKQILRNVLCRA
jgi:hypothetical protein